MIYRSAKPEDAEAIAHVHIAGWRFAYRGILTDALLAALDTERRAEYWYRQLIDSGVDVLVAVEKDTICGFYACGAPRDPNEAPTSWELRSIYVLPDRHKRGIGKALFDLALHASRRRGASIMTLWVAERNTSARSFYNSRGMRSDGSAQTHAVSDGAVLQRVKYTLQLM